MSVIASKVELQHDQDREAARRAAVLAGWRRQSRRIRFMRKALPATMGLLLLMMAGWVATRAVLSAINAASGAGAAIHMTNARFHGRDGQGKPFVIASTEAVRDGLDVNKITLTAPKFELASEPGFAPRQMRGDHGVYFDDRKLLYMDGHVTFQDGKGARFTSEHATLKLDEGSVTGNSGVSGDSPLGHIDASSYSVDQHGDHVVFVGNVHGHFVTDQERGQ